MLVFFILNKIKIFGDIVENMCAGIVDKMCDMMGDNYMKST